MESSLRRSDDEVVGYAETIPGHYDRNELQTLLSHVRSLPPDARIVEIGVEYGRSACIYLQCPEHWHDLHLVDNRSYNAAEGTASTALLIDRWSRTMSPAHSIWEHRRDSVELAANWPPNRLIDLLHIDGDHEIGVWDDCSEWLELVKIGGIVVFHDYQRRGADGTGDVFPAVTSAVDAYCNDYPHRWGRISHLNTQIAFRRLP